VNQFLNNPERIEVAKPATTAKTITQNFVYCPNGEDWAKREVLRDLIRGNNVKNAIIFCNRKRDVAVLHKSLTKHGFNAGALHGDMDQASRMETLDKFRAGEIMLLAASDVAARGLDIPEVSHVFNFDLPWAADDYVHRIGRTGRAGHEGHAISLVSPDDLKLCKDIEKVTAEAPVWLGDPPTEEDFASAGKRRRGRGGRGQSSGSDKSRRQSHGSQRGGRTGEHHARSSQHASRPAEQGAQQPERRHRQPEHKAPQPDQHHTEAAEHPHHERRRAPRPERTPQPEYAEQPKRSSENARQPQRPRPAPARDAWTDEPAPAQRTARHDRPERREAPKEAPRKQQPHKADERLGFAENVPAFMRKPSRPLKVPGRG
ncbi:MAG: DEAD/DEAH box helicase, partial [Proteobacteria bacterium]|nr:DEAD/DEAH box helicase [Pseudomonadota bacterium]